MTETISREEKGSALKRVLRPMIPERLLKDREIYLRLDPSAGRVYARLRLLDTLGIRRANCKRVPRHARSFVFVCFGNIMRSPMAELMFKRAAVEHHQDGVDVCSAGIHAIDGTPAHPRAQLAGRELGFPLDHHRAKPLTAEVVAGADAIFAMDFQNQAELVTLFPQARQKIFMLSAYAAGSGRGREIPDPYFGDQEAARRCYAVLRECVKNLAEQLWPLASYTPSERAARIR